VKGYLVEKVRQMQKDYRKKVAKDKAHRIKQRESRRLQKLGLEVPAIFQPSESEKTEITTKEENQSMSGTF
jgi:hypothetical protein